MPRALRERNRPLLWSDSVYRLRPSHPLHALLRRLGVGTLTQLAWLPPWLVARMAGQRRHMERLQERVRAELGPAPEADLDLPWPQVLPFLPLRVQECLRLVGLFSVSDVLHIVEAGVLRSQRWLNLWEQAALHDSLDAVGWAPALPMLEATPTPLAWPPSSPRLSAMGWRHSYVRVMLIPVAETAAGYTRRGLGAGPPVTAPPSV